MDAWNIRWQQDLRLWIHGHRQAALPELDAGLSALRMDRIRQTPMPFDQRIFADPDKMRR